MGKWILFIALIVSCGNATGQFAVDSIAVENLGRTKRVFVDRWIDIEVGDTVSMEQIDKDVQSLRNLNLFFNVDYRLDTINGKATLCFIIREAHYVYPSFENIASSKNINFSVGVTDINFLGRGQHFGVLYRYYDRHSAKIFHSSLVHKNRLTGHSVVLGSYASVEPLYFGEEVRDFNYTNYQAIVEGWLWLRKRVSVSLGGGYLRESYKNVSEDIFFPDGEILNGANFAFNKYQIKTGVQWRNINYDMEFRNGIQTRFEAERIITGGFTNPFVKATTDVQWFKRVGNRGNLCVRNSLGISTNNESPFSPFLIDNYANIRGSGNRVERGTAEAILNVEFHYCVWRNKFFTLQTSAFADFGTLRPPGASFEDFVRDAALYRYAGMGVRIHSNVLYKTIIRFDYSFNLEDLRKGGFVVGFGHYF